MSRLIKYFSNHLGSAFYSYFLPLFGIASLIFFIKIVSLTAIVELSLSDLAKMYIFITPQILFFTIPVVFFIAAVVSLHKLSFEYETIALFSLGISPKKINRFLLIFASFLSILLLAISLILIPQGKQLEKGFYRLKKTRANINLKPSEYGHKFGEWFVYVQEKQKNIFHNVVLYKTEKNGNQRFITAKKARFGNSEEGLKLTLYDGYAYSYTKDSLDEIAYKQLDLFDTSTSFFYNYTDPIQYWLQIANNKQRLFDFLFFLLISFFPLATIHLASSIGIHHPRYSKGGVFAKSFLVIVLYFSLAFVMSKNLHALALLLIPLFMVAGSAVFAKTVLRRY